MPGGYVLPGQLLGLFRPGSDLGWTLVRPAVFLPAFGMSGGSFLLSAKADERRRLHAAN